MTLTDFFIVIATISLAVIVAAMVPALIQINRSARKVEILIDNINIEISPLLKNLSQTSVELQTLSSSLNNKIVKTDAIIDTVQQSADTLLITSNILKNTVMPLITQVGGFGAGLRAFISFFSKPEK